MSSLKIVQINLHHCKAASDELLQTLAEEDADVALIQEPWLAKDRVQGLGSRTHTLLVPTNQGILRSCILVKKQLNVLLLPQHCTKDLTTVMWERRGKPSILLASAYMPFDEDDPPAPAVTTLVSWAKSERLDLIMGCDANAHHTIWGSSDINKRGESIFEYLLSTNLVISNRGTHPTFFNKNREQVIDITLVSNSDSLKVENWKVSPKCSFSDHFAILFTINLKKTKPIPYRNPIRTNWNKFSTLLDRIHPPSEEDTLSKTGIENAVSHLSTSLRKAFLKSCPISRPPKKHHAHWWTSELRQLRSETRKLFTKAKGTQSTEAWAAYKSSFNTFKSATRKAKRDSWQSFCEEIEGTNEASRLRKMLSKDPGTPGLLSGPGGIYTETSQESLELLMNTHFPGCKDVTNIMETHQGHGQVCELIKETITRQKVEWAIKSFKPFKSGGPDNIIPAMLHRLTATLINWLVKIFQGCLATGYIPIEWREVRVVFIPKSGKPNHNTAKDYRPISLSSFFLKTLERLVDLHLRRKLNANNFSTAQHAYLKGRSVETALHDVVGTIERSLMNKEFTLAAFLDIEGAFNNVKLQSINTEMVNIGLDHKIIQWINNMLNCRIINSTLGCSSVRKTVTRGTPQGGVISPMLWNLVINKILSKLSRSGIKIVAYADDVVILITGKFLSTISELMSTALQKLSNWACENGLGVNPSKTELVLFTRKYKIPSFTLPSIGGTTLNLSKEAKYLGIVLDSKLSWKRNSEERMKKALNAFYICRRTFGKRWGLRPCIIHWMYTAIIRPILTYGAVVWWEAVQTNSYLSNLNKVQRLACLGITGAIKSTPQVGLESILHLLPIDCFMKCVAAKSAMRLKTQNKLDQSTSGHASILNKFQFGDLGPNTDYHTPEIDFEKPYQIHIPTRKDWEENRVINANVLSIFTDGSKTESGTGSGVFSEKLGINKSFGLPNYCSVFQAEIFAVTQAAKTVRNKGLAPCNLTFFVDSLAAIKAIESNTVKSKCVGECRKSLRLIRQHNIKLCWVPGHSDVPGNERADECARHGSSLDSGHIEESINAPLQEYYNAIEAIVLRDTSRRWHDTTNCIIARTLWPKLNLRKTQELLKFNKSSIRMLIGVITGHCAIGHMAARYGVPHHDFCRSCRDEEEIETVQHLLCDCPALQGKRLKHLGNTFLAELNNVSKTPLMNLYNFIKESGWFTPQTTL